MTPSICPSCGAYTNGGIPTKVKTAPDPEKTPAQKRLENGIKRALPRGVPVNTAQIKPFLPVRQPLPVKPPVVPKQPVTPKPSVTPRPNSVQKPNIVDIQVDPDFMDQEANLDPQHHRNVADSADFLGL